MTQDHIAHKCQGQYLNPGSLNVEYRTLTITVWCENPVFYIAVVNRYEYMSRGVCVCVRVCACVRICVCVWQ